MKPLFLILAVGLSAVASHGQGNAKKPAAPSAPDVTRENFVSLSVETFGGFAGIRSSTVITSSSITEEGRPPGSRATQPPAPKISPLSQKQLGALIRILHDAKIPSLVGKYEDKNLRDGFNETVTLTISDGDDRDKTYTIQNYGQSAPKGYYAFMGKLREFVALKSAPKTIRPVDGSPEG